MLLTLGYEGSIEADVRQNTETTLTIKGIFIVISFSCFIKAGLVLLCLGLLFDCFMIDVIIINRLYCSKKPRKASESW